MQTNNFREILSCTDDFPSKVVQNEQMNYCETLQEAPVKSIPHRNTHHTTEQQAEPVVFCKCGPIPRDGEGEAI